jgi:hypothetical protein
VSEGEDTEPKASDLGPSLLDRRTHGWTVSEQWPDLFTLWARGDEVAVDLSPELQAIENALMRGHHIHGSKELIKLSSALFQLAVLKMARRDASTKLQPGTFEGMSVEIVRALLDAGLGEFVLDIIAAKTRREIDMAEASLVNLVKISVRGLVRLKFPSKAFGSGDPIPKELLAIWTARMLCERFKRLPAKRELRHELEALGIAYNKPRYPDGPWRTLFARAGLSSLPD